jgi:hypothetical protein
VFREFNSLDGTKHEAQDTRHLSLAHIVGLSELPPFRRVIDFVHCVKFTQAIKLRQDKTDSLSVHVRTVRRRLRLPPLAG